MQVLDGIRVLDVSIAMAGPFAAQKLGDLGADVIKVEPVSGEWQRHTAAGGATGNEMNASFLSLNRNKRSVALNLKIQEAREALYKLVEGADVFLQNYRPGVASRLGVDYDTLRKINPKLIYVSISGYGEDGPYAQRAGQDLVLQGISGALASTQRTGEAPRPAPYFLVDTFTAYSAFEGTLAALFYREKTGQGQRVSVNMLDAITAAQMQEITVHTVGQVKQKPSESIQGHSYIRAPYGVYRTLDDYIVVAFAEPKLLAEVFGDDRLFQYDAERDGFTNRDEISNLVEENLLTNTTQHWLDTLLDAGVWAGPVNDYDELLDDPQIVHNETFVEYTHPTEGYVKTPGFPFRLERTAQAVQRPAPTAGEHTTEVLEQVGLTPEEVESLLSSKAAHQGRTNLPMSSVR